MAIPCNSSSSSSALSLISPSPKSPPACPDLYGKRRQLARVQVLEREISMLEEELKSLEGLQLASRCCKELDDFIGGKLDPFLAINQKPSKSNIFWKRLWRKLSCRFPRVCCCFYGSFHLNTKICCDCCQLEKSCQRICTCPNLSCRGCSCNWLKSCFGKFQKVKLCCNCTKACYAPCCLY